LPQVRLLAVSGQFRTASTSWSTSTTGSTSPARACEVLGLDGLPQAYGNAVAPPGTRIVTEDMMKKLGEALRKATLALADANNWGDPKAVAEQFSAHRLLAQGLVEPFSVKPRSLLTVASPIGRRYGAPSSVPGQLSECR
jgi:hypothetical protein